MKILQVIPYFCFGGAEIMCENLTYALTAQGHQVSVVSLYNEHTPISERMEKAGIRFYYLDKKLGLDISMVPKLMKIMKEEKPDVVHTHLDVIKYAVAAAKLVGIKRCVHTMHTVAHKEAEGRLQKLINGFYFRHGWSVPVALSPEVQQTVSGFYGMDKSKVPVIYNGIDLNKCREKESYCISGDPSLIHVGRFDVPKNHKGLLQAFARVLLEYPDCKLHLVGDGDLRPEIEQLVAQLQLNESVIFHGMQSDVHPYLQSADVFVLSSSYEGMPMTIIEAMGTGLPIVASAVGGVPDMIRDGQSGFLVKPVPEEIANMILKLLRDTSLREKLGSGAKEDSIRFSAEYMAEEYCQVYK